MCLRAVAPRGRPLLDGRGSDRCGALTKGVRLTSATSKPDPLLPSIAQSPAGGYRAVMLARGFVALILCVGLGCRSHRTDAPTLGVTKQLPRMKIDEALALARNAAAGEYAVDLYTINGCERDANGWWISFHARPVDAVGAAWSPTQKERWLALGNHFSVQVHDDRTIRLHGGR